MQLDYFSITNLLFVAVTAIFTITTAVVFYTVLTRGKFISRRNMKGKTVIITGANSGIGKETARGLAILGARVIMACRNLESANAVKDDIYDVSKNDEIIVKKLDLSSQQSIREFAADILKTEKRLDILIHNAGFAETFSKSKSIDGIEMTMATNHYGPFLLTHLLIDLLKKSTPSRIVIVASELYRLASVNLDNLNPVSTLPAYLYYVSKCANIMFCQELARRLEGTNVTANCLHPGLVDTGIWRSVPFPLSLPMAVMKLFFKTPEQGAATTLHVAVSEKLIGVNGKYFSDCRKAGLSAGIQDVQRAKRLWEESVKMVKLTSADPKI